MSPGFWPLTWRGEDEIKHDRGATKFFVAGANNDRMKFTFR
jgi:hypothetical protein